MVCNKTSVRMEVDLTMKDSVKYTKYEWYEPEQHKLTTAIEYREMIMATETDSEGFIMERFDGYEEGTKYKLSHCLLKSKCWKFAAATENSDYVKNYVVKR